MLPPRYTRDTLSVHPTKCGLGEDAAKWTASCVQERGCVTDQRSTDAKEHLVCVLHLRSWMRYGSSEEVVVTCTAGRQGCKLGGVVYGRVYAQALKIVRAQICYATL